LRHSILRGVLAEDQPVNAFLVGDNPAAKARVAALMESVDMRALDAAGLGMTHVLEWAGVQLVGVAGNGAGFDTALCAATP
jgi:predicted dinucleotide-binding enzyme